MSWPIVPLGEVADTALGKMLDKGKPKGYEHVQYLRNVNVQWGRIDTDDLLTIELADDERDRFAVKQGDLLVCEGGDIGRAAIWHGRSEYIAYQKALHRIGPGDKVEPLFLRYLLEHHAKSGTLAGLSTGSTIAHLPQQQLRRVPVPLPPLDQQHRIVELLEDHLSRLDAAETGLRQAERRLLALERSAPDDCFGAAEDDVLLSELVEGIQAGKSFGSANAPAAEDEWGIIKVSAMTWGEFRAEENKAVTGDRVDPRYEIREGDLLVSRANTSEHVGASVLVGPVRPRLLLSDKSLRVEPRTGVSAEWLWRALQAPKARSQISALATGTKDSMRNISQSSLLRVRVPSADPAAQAEALPRFGDITSASGPTRSALANARRRSEALRRSLLAAAFSGELSARARLAA